MKNVKLLILVSLLASLFLASCGGATPAPTEEPTSIPEPTEEPTPVPEPAEEPTPEPEPTEAPEPEPPAAPEGTAAILDAAGAYFGEGTKLILAEALYENLNDGDDSNDPAILDIRAAEDYAAGHVPGAVSIGGGALFDTDTLDALPTDGQIVVYCYSGQTAGQTVAALRVLGYDAVSLKGGMGVGPNAPLGWANNGFPVVQ